MRDYPAYWGTLMHGRGRDGGAPVDIQPNSRPSESWSSPDARRHRRGMAAGVPKRSGPPAGTVIRCSPPTEVARRRDRRPRHEGRSARLRSQKTRIPGGTAILSTTGRPDVVAASRTCAVLPPSNGSPPVTPEEAGERPAWCNRLALPRVPLVRFGADRDLGHPPPGDGVDAYGLCSTVMSRAASSRQGHAAARRLSGRSRRLGSASPRVSSLGLRPDLDRRRRRHSRGPGPFKALHADEWPKLASNSPPTRRNRPEGRSRSPTLRAYVRPPRASTACCSGRHPEEKGPRALDASLSDSSTKCA